MMGIRGFILIIVGWCLYIIIEYYYILFFLIPFIHLGLLLVLLLILILQSTKLIEERKRISKLRVAKVIIFALLFYFSLDWWSVNKFIERMDWKIFYNKRMEIVEEVKDKELSPNNSMGNNICELPFEFPVVSNGGNDISIYRGEDSTVTVKFFISRGFINTPPTCFVYTNDKKLKEELEVLIRKDPANNWKIDENWYRAMSE